MKQELTISSLPKIQQVAVIIPCYNEAKRIQGNLFVDFIENHEKISLIFVNDGSRDQTIEILNRLAGHPSGRIEVLNLHENQGKGEAVRRGIQKAIASGYEFVGYLDADLATPLEAVPQLIEIFKRFPDVWLVMGSRVQLLGREIHRHLIRHYLGRIFATVVSIMLKLRVYDTQCGAKFFRNNAAIRAIFARRFVSRWIFDVEIIRHLTRMKDSNGLIHAGKRIYEMPLDKWQDVAGSKVKFRDFFKAIADLFRIGRIDFSGDTPENETGNFI